MVQQPTSTIPQNVKKSVEIAIQRCLSKAFGYKGTEGIKETELIRQRYFRDLTSESFKAAIQQAAIDNDEKFFRRLGRILNSDPEPLPQPFPEEADRFTLESSLIRFWIPGERPSAGFCQMSDPLIAEAINTLLDRGRSSSLLPNTIRKNWERLGLKKVKGKLYTRKSQLPAGPADLPRWTRSDLIRPPIKP